MNQYKWMDKYLPNAFDPEVIKKFKDHPLTKLMERADRENKDIHFYYGRRGLTAEFVPKKKDKAPT